MTSINFLLQFFRQSLMMTANFLQLSRVRDACAEFLMARLCPSNVLGVKTFADTLGKLWCKNYQTY